MARNLVSVPVVRIKGFKYLFDEHINNQNQADSPIGLKKIRGERSKLSTILKKHRNREADDLITISKPLHRELTTIISTMIS